MTEANPYQTPAADLSGNQTEALTAPSLWNPNAAGLWSVLLTPVFGQTLVYKNWQAIGDEKQIADAKKMLAICIAMIIVPFLVNVNSISIAWLVAWYLISQKKQAIYVKEEWDNDYPRNKWSLPLLIGVTTFVLIFITLVGILMALDATGYSVL